MQILKTTLRTHTATLDEIRDVWALISENPAITVRDVAERMSMSITRAHYVIKFLERTRYVTHKKGQTGRCVRIPFVRL